MGFGSLLPRSSCSCSQAALFVLAVATIAAILGEELALLPLAMRTQQMLLLVLPAHGTVALFPRSNGRRARAILKVWFLQFFNVSWF